MEYYIVVVSILIDKRLTFRRKKAYFILFRFSFLNPVMNQIHNRCLYHLISLDTMANRLYTTGRGIE